MYYRSLVGAYPYSKVHGADIGPTWVLPAPDGPHVGPMNLAIRVVGCSNHQHGFRNDIKRREYLEMSFTTGTDEGDPQTAKLHSTQAKYYWNRILTPGWWFWIHHDDVTKWKHFPRYWPFVRGIHRPPVNSPHKRQWRGALLFSLICAWITGE